MILNNNDIPLRKNDLYRNFKIGNYHSIPLLLIIKKKNIINSSLRGTK